MVPAGSLEELEAVPAAGAVQILVLCHTLSEAERSSALNMSKARWPNVKVLSISECGFGRAAQRGGDAALESCKQPLALLDSVARLLER